MKDVSDTEITAGIPPESTAITNEGGHAEVGVLASPALSNGVPFSYTDSGHRPSKPSAQAVRILQTGMAGPDGLPEAAPRQMEEAPPRGPTCTC